MVEDGELFGVAEVRRRTGLSRKALRLYEEAGLVAPATRTQAGYRLYDAGGLQRLELIRRARALGLHLRQLPEFLVADAVVILTPNVSPLAARVSSTTGIRM